MPLPDDPHPLENSTLRALLWAIAGLRAKMLLRLVLLQAHWPMPSRRPTLWRPRLLPSRSQKEIVERLRRPKLLAPPKR
jgi:hypothetical protein